MRPKLVPLTHANLLASARQIAAALELTPDDHYSQHHAAVSYSWPGRRLAVGACERRERSLSYRIYRHEFFFLVEEFRPTWYTAVPAMHQAILAETKNCAGTIARKPLRFIRSCRPLCRGALQGSWKAFLMCRSLKLTA